MFHTEQAIEENIRTRAYLLWEASGKPEVAPDECWHQARERIEAEYQAAYPPVQARAHHP
ncbi:MAG: DUF2934 domain-containing protein [Janthinobacterium lividum]